MQPNESILPKVEFEKKSIVLITSREPDNDGFGSGFVIHHQGNLTYIVTCAHVVDHLGGSDFIKVEGISANVLVRSPHGYADDLAILQVEGLAKLPIIPICDCGVPGLSFKGLGYSLFDAKNRFFDLDEIYGDLGKKRLIRGASQSLPVESWEIKINHDLVLKKGHSGSPILDERSYNVLGVISYLEGTGKTGRAISITALDKIVQDSSITFIRGKRYCLNSICKLLKDVFKDKHELYQCFAKHFPNIFTQDLPFLVMIEFLTISCHQEGSVEKLLDTVRSFAPRKYNKYLTDVTCQSRLKVSSHRIHKFFLLGCIAHIFKGIDHSESGRLEIDTPGKFPEPISVSESKVRAIARILELSRDEIKIIVVKEGSVKLEIELPSTSLEKFIKLFEEDRGLMRDLGVNYLVEVFEENYIVSNIENLLFAAYSSGELIDLCQRNFDNVFRFLEPEFDKDRIISELTSYLKQESEFSTLLRILSREKKEAVRQYEPYIKIPRRPFSNQTSTNSSVSRKRAILRRPSKQAASRQSSRWRFFWAATTGSLLTAIATAILFHATGLIYQLSDDLVTGSLLGTLQILALEYFGDLTGQVVYRLSGRRGGASIGQLARVSFLVGVFLSPIFYVLPFLPFHPEFSEFISNLPKNIFSLIATFIVIIIVVIILLVIGYLRAFISIITSDFIRASILILATAAGVARGSVSAYSRAS